MEIHGDGFPTLSGYEFLIVLYTSGAYILIWSMGLSLANLAASALIGIDKGGIPGLGALGMALALAYNHGGDNIGHLLAIFAPVLMIADIGAIVVYWKEVQFGIVLKLAVSIAVGMVVGFIFLGNQDEGRIRRVTGLSLLVLSIVYYVSKFLRRYCNKFHILPRSNDDDKPKSDYLSVLASNGIFKSVSAAMVGIVTGGLTVIANVAGPIIAIYFIQLQLPKRSLNGTRAILFLFINFVKIPAQVYIGNFELTDIYVVFPLCCISLISTFLTERYLMPYIDQAMFENVAWILVAIGAIRLAIP
jgi:hypothetical protein